MPTEHVIDASRGLVRSRAWGELSSNDLVAHYASLAADPAFQRHFQQLGDLRDVVSFTVDSRVIAAEAATPLFAPNVRRALVANTDVGYGLARMFAAYAEGAAQHVRVFRDIAEAEAWLQEGR
jgi:hypothetical protein